MGAFRCKRLALELHLENPEKQMGLKPLLFQQTPQHPGVFLM